MFTALTKEPNIYSSGDEWDAYMASQPFAPERLTANIIHEALHELSHKQHENINEVYSKHEEYLESYKGIQSGSDFNEGITEFFTRIIYGNVDSSNANVQIPNSPYEDQVQAIKEMISDVSQHANITDREAIILLGKFYFEGDERFINELISSQQPTIQERIFSFLTD
jgi:hypothetical protein